MSTKPFQGGIPMKYFLVVKYFLSRVSNGSYTSVFIVRDRGKPGQDGPLLAGKSCDWLMLTNQLSMCSQVHEGQDGAW